MTPNIVYNCKQTHSLKSSLLVFLLSNPLQVCPVLMFIFINFFSNYNKFCFIAVQKLNFQKKL